MMANYSQISMDLEQNMQMLTNSQSQHQLTNYYASSQSIFDPSSSPSSTASSSASSVNSTPSSKMDYHAFNGGSNSNYTTNSSADASIMYGSTKRSKSSLAFPNLYQNNQQHQHQQPHPQQQQNGSFRPQLMHSQSANNDLIQDRSTNSTTQDVILKFFKL